MEITLRTPTKDQQEEMIELATNLQDLIIDNELQEFLEVMIEPNIGGDHPQDVIYAMSDEENYE